MNEVSLSNSISSLNLKALITAASGTSTSTSKKNLTDIDIPFHAVECKHYKDGWNFKPEWLEQTIEAAGKTRGYNIPILIFRFNRKPVRVCLPMHAINPEWEVDPYLNCVISLDQWFEVLKRNWEHYLRNSYPRDKYMSGAYGGPSSRVE